VIYAEPWDATREHELAHQWAASSDPVLSTVGLWHLAANPLTSEATALSAVARLRSTVGLLERDTYAMFLARLGRYDEAIAIANDLLNNDKQLASLYASQITRFTLVRNRHFSNAALPPDARTFYVHAICAIGNQVYFYQADNNMPDESDCPNELLIMGHYAGSAPAFHHLELDTDILALPVDTRQ